MKQIKLDVGIEADKIVTALRTVGYEDNNMSDQLELLGIAENIKGIFAERIKVLANKRESVKDKEDEL